MAKLKLDRIANDPECIAQESAALWQEVGRPMVVYKYAEPPYRRICNPSKVSRKAHLAKEGKNCCCAEAWAQPFVERCRCEKNTGGACADCKASGHIVTKDLGVIEHFSPALARLMAKGTKYRDAPVELREPPKDYPNGDTLRGKVRFAVDSGIDAFVKTQIERDREPPHAWALAVAERAGQAIDALSEEELDCPRGWTSTLPVQLRIQSVHVDSPVQSSPIQSGPVQSSPVFFFQIS